MKTLKFFLACSAALAIFSCQPQVIEDVVEEPEKTTQNDDPGDTPDDTPGDGKVEGVKANYEDFIGRWIVTGTEHQWFMDEGETPATYSYSIQIEAAEEGKTYAVKNWETWYTEEDRAHLYYGATEEQSIYDYLMGINVNADITA